jgi:hypothetical protein
VKLLDRMPDSALRTRAMQWGLLAAGPATVSGIVWLVNIVSGTAFAPGCGIAGVLVDAAIGSGVRDALVRLLPLFESLTAPTSECTSVPFSADLPNMVLSVTAGLAVSVYVVFNLRLRLLRGDLETSGLVSTASLERSGLGQALAAGLPRRQRDVLLDVGLALVSLVGSAAMYYWLYTHGPIFRDLAGSYRHMGSTGATTEVLRQNWWANHETHPVNTALGIAVGAIGLFFALKQRSVFVLIGRWLRRLRVSPRPVEFVPKWLDRDYGWRPVSGLVSLGYLAVLTFLASFSAALYALRSDEPGLSRLLSLLLALIAIFAAVTNGIFIVSLITTIRRLFSGSVAYERARILAALRQPDGPAARRRRRSLDRLYLLTEGTNLADVPGYPISGRWLRFAGVLPAFLGALWTFSTEVGRAIGF